MSPKVKGNSPKPRDRRVTRLVRRAETLTGKEKFEPVTGTLVRLRSGRLVPVDHEEAVVELRLRRLERRAR